MSKLIMGIDPGTNFMGYAILKTDGRNKKPGLIVSGVITMNKISDPYIKLQQIFKRTLRVIDDYHPDELAIESQFFGKNVQSMLKLGRAQGVAIAAALQRDIPIFEYAPLKIKMSVTGSGSASKEQIAGMLDKLMDIETSTKKLDETDAIAIAYCHFLQSTNPLFAKGIKSNSWSDYIKLNPELVKR